MKCFISGRLNRQKLDLKFVTKSYGNSNMCDNSQMNLRQQNAQGFTLIEIMIALLLGAFLMGGIMQIFVSNKKSYHLTEGQSRLQENARFALELLGHDIRLAGFLGCSSVSATNPTVLANSPLVAPRANDGDATVVADSSITGGNNTVLGTFTTPNPALSTNPPNPAFNPNPINNAIIGTDAITVQFGESCGGYTTVVTPIPQLPPLLPEVSVNPTVYISPANTCGINLGTGTTFADIGTPLVISDCATAHVFRASAGAGQNTNALGATPSLGKSYAIGSEIMLFRSYTYYIQLGASGEPSLFRLNNNYPRTANSNPEEMIEGVENMQILYGLDEAPIDGSANRFIATPTAAQWPNIVSVRIVLTMRTLEDNLVSVNNPPRTYNGNNNFIDRRLVKTFTTTIDFRNR